ncbi:MAG TPA: antibiotic biosynthesis monooxygenase [Dissulfurispiraceae bacterium]|nr:antibiotic biosynthesis monooxygenase [Dissulfurispiraceae bacterium]
MILSFVKMNAVPSKRQSIIDILRSVEGQTRAKPGCSSCAVYEAPDQRRTILYVEQWESGEQLSRHIRSTLYLRVLAAMELANEPPEISFHEVTETKGIELIEHLRA